MKQRFYLTPHVEAELKRVGRYTEKRWGVLRRNKYLADLNTRFIWLADHPRLGTHRPEIATGFYCYKQGTHTIFYMIAEQAIHIIGLSHQSMDRKSKLKPKINVVSLFSGCGGMDLGFSSQGFNINWANDFDEKACKTYASNIGDHIVHGDITQLDYSLIPDAHVILGGFPCQDFSMLWKREGLETNRGNLYRNFVEIVSQKNPLMFIAENVKGLLTANQKKAIGHIIEDFSHAGIHGYRTKVHLVNFANYGVPQLRERVLIIGVRKDIKEEFHIPCPTHFPKTYVTAKQALEDVECAQFNNEYPQTQPKTVEMLNLIPSGGNFSDIPKDSPHYVKGMMSLIYRRLHPDKPSTTIIATGGGGTSGYHYEEPRPLTNRERARLFGYPDDFVFEGSVTEVRRQIGNSVPPVGIKPFAKAIKDYLRQL